VFAFSALGAVVQFFYYNVFGNAEKQTKIFMGDTGALTIGILLSFFALKLCSHNRAEINDVNPLVMAAAPLILPCFDVVRVFMGRIRRGNNPFLPDKTHIHHKLMAIGMSTRLTMIVLIVVSILFTLLNIVMSPYLNANLLLLLDIAAWVVFNIWLTKAIAKRQR
jgi:UDP-N-acetylmuramyl pentapeptide phosphotransferase/UDP-N-acetylglucosamine-1-phosphate transferase